MFADWQFSPFSFTEQRAFCCANSIILIWVVQVGCVGYVTIFAFILARSHLYMMYDVYVLYGGKLLSTYLSFTFIYQISYYMIFFYSSCRGIQFYFPILHLPFIILFSPFVACVIVTGGIYFFHFPTIALWWYMCNITIISICIWLFDWFKTSWTVPMYRSIRGIGANIASAQREKSR